MSEKSSTVTLYISFCTRHAIAGFVNDFRESIVIPASIKARCEYNTHDYCRLEGELYGIVRLSTYMKTFHSLLSNLGLSCTALRTLFQALCYQSYDINRIELEQVMELVARIGYFRTRKGNIVRKASHCLI
jgi:hypothetical protein